MNISVLTDWIKGKELSASNIIFAAFVGTFFTFSLGTSPPLIFACLATAVWLFSGKFITRRHRYLKKKWLRPILILVVLPWIGLLYSSDNSGLGIDYAEKTYYWIFCVAIASICAPNRSHTYLIYAFLAGLAINALIAGIQFVGWLPHKGAFYLGIGPGYSALSAYLVTGILMASFYFRETSSTPHRLFLCLLMGLYFFHLVILEGRGGYVTFVLLSPMLVRNFFKKFELLKIISVIIVLLGFMMLSSIVRERIALSIERIKYHMNAPPDLSWGKTYNLQEERLYMWRGAVKIFLDHPLRGAGTGGYQSEMRKIGDPKTPLITHPHNSILYIAASFGIIGLLAFFWFFWEIIVSAWKERETELGYFILSVAVVIFVSGMVNTQIIDVNAAFPLAVTAGLQQGLKRNVN